MPQGGRLRTWGPPAIRWAFFLLLPFAVLWRFAPPYARLTIGWDYILYPFDAQLEIIWAWHHGFVPLFMPGFAGGSSSSTMTLGQAWHPISWLCALTPGYGNGHAEVIATFYRFLEIGITHRIVYRETRQNGLDRLPSFLLSFVVVFNGRMLDSFRYGSSLETYCAMLLACVVFSAARREGWTFKRICWGATTIFLVFVGGHPQWALFAVIAACFFGAGLLTRPTPDLPHASRPRFIGGMALSGLLGGLLSAGYLLPFALEFMAENVARVDQSYGFTLGYSDDVRGTLANFSRPLEADVHGAFGGSIWPLVFVFAAPIALVTLKKPLPVVVPALAALAAELFAVGAATPFHRWVVENVPLFSSFRVPGRSSLWVPPMMLLIGWVVLSDLSRPELRRRFARGPVIAWAAGLALLAHGAFQILVPDIQVQGFSPLFLGGSPRWSEPALVALFAVTATMAMLFGLPRPRIRRTAWIICLFATTACAAIALPFGTWRDKRVPFRTFAAMDDHHAQYLTFWGQSGFGLEPRSVARATAAGLPLARPSGELIEHWVLAEDDETAVKLAKKLTSETVLSGKGVAARAGKVAPAAVADGAPDPQKTKTEIDEDELEAPKADLDDAQADAPSDLDDVKPHPDAVKADANIPAPAPSAGRPGAVEPRAIQWNRWRFGVKAPEGGAFVFGQPKLPQWRATVDGRPATLVTANGTFPAVLLEPGEHEVELRFVSRAAMLGAGIFAFVLIGLLAVRHRFLAKDSGAQRILTAIAIVLVLAMGGLWYRSLWPDIDVRNFGKAAAVAPGKSTS